MIGMPQAASTASESLLFQRKAILGESVVSAEKHKGGELSCALNRRMMSSRLNWMPWFGDKGRVEPVA